MLQEEELKGAPVLVLANKQDLPNALNDQEVNILAYNEIVYN
jgi:signal recognition particle receptor subunit beta